MDLSEARSYLAIDKHALDDEIVRQPALFEKVSDAYVTAAADRDAAEEALGAIHAILDGQIRASDDDLKEAQIKAQIKCSARHAKAVEDYLEAKELAARWGVLKDAFQARGFMLRDLVSLHTAGYFESTAIKSTAAQDRAVYEGRRARLEAARQTK